MTLEDEDTKGDPVLFTNQEIRRMLRLADVGKKDVFYDLGSGWGQNLVVALTEFGAARVVGIEKDEERRQVSLHRLGRWAKVNPAFKGRYDVVLGDFDDLFTDKLKGANLGEATVIFYGLSTYTALTEAIKNKWKGRGNRLAYYFYWLFPEIIPDRSDFPFHVSDFPFKEPKSEFEWLSKIVRKDRSSLNAQKPPDENELWDELTHDYDLRRQADEVRYYKRKLKEIVGKKQGTED